MALKPLYGAMNNTIAKTIASNAPKYKKIVEPFGDGGTFALFTAKRPPKEHIVNITDETLFNAMLFAKSYTASDMSELKRKNWVSSQETFDMVSMITDTEGPDFIYRFLYMKKFGMKMLGAEEITWDAMSVGKDFKNNIYAFPLMKSMLKRVTFTSDDPMGLMAGDGFTILVPPNDQIDAVKTKLKGLSGDFFFAGKAASADSVIQDAQSLDGLNVAGIKVASIMMASYSIVTNYESRLEPIKADEAMDM
jgi:hypothetical protein